MGVIKDLGGYYFKGLTYNSFEIWWLFEVKLLFLLS